MLTPTSHWPRLTSRYEEELAAGRAGKDEAEDTDDVQRRSYVPLDAVYPPRKRAERLSWMVWALLNDQQVGVNSFGGSPHQVRIEAHGTSERLRLARSKMRELRERLAQ